MHDSCYIADNYDDEVDVAVSALLSLLEPMLVVVRGGIVGTIVLALFLPLVKMILYICKTIIFKFNLNQIIIKCL